MFLRLPDRPELFRYTYQVRLDDEIYTIGIRFNTRWDRYILSIATADGTQLLGGIPVLVGIDLLGRFKNPLLPPGILVALNATAANVEAGRGELGTDVLLVYQEAT